MELKLFITPPIQAAGTPGYQIQLRGWMLVKGGRRYRYQPFESNAEVDCPQTG